MFFLPVIVHPVLICLAAQTLGARAEADPTEKLKELNWKDGLTGSTSSYKDKEWGSDKAFFPQEEDKNSWACDRNKIPATVWNHFPYKVKLGRISFSSREDQSDARQAPKEFDVVGSSDCENWMNILSVTATFTEGNETKSWNIPKENRQEFDCVGIRVRESKKQKSFAAIQNLKMWDTAVENLKQECGNECGNKHGICNFCGKGSCCQIGLLGRGCDGQNGCSGTNCCVDTLGVAQTEKLTEVNLDVGIPGASSEWDGVYKAERAFAVEKAGELSWCSGKNVALPHTVWTRLPSPIKLGKISFSSRAASASHHPSKFAIVGSSDCSNWTTIIERNTTFAEKNKTYFWMIPSEKRQQFECIGIKILEVKGGTQQTACFQNLKMWDINECDSNPCKNGGTCDDKIKTYTCSCKDGFEGNNCEIDIDECASNPCENGGTCEDKINTYTCSCKDGFEGNNCEKDIDECVSNPCKNGGTCEDKINTYTCSCKDGFEGNNCEKEIRWRGDLRCGSGYPASTGEPAECNPDSKNYCCSPGKWCGKTAHHCDCATCVNYKEKYFVEKEPTLATKEPTLATEEPTLATEEPTLATEEPTLATKEPTLATEEPTLAPNDPITGVIEINSKLMELVKTVKQNKRDFQELDKRVKNIEGRQN